MSHPAFKGRLLRWLNRGETSAWATEPMDYDPDAVERIVSLLDHFFGPNRPWEARVHGLENVPSAPVLVVANHSGGTVIPDAWGLGWAWYRHFGTGRPLHFLAHEWVLPFRSLGEALGQRGLLWASPANALRALRECSHDVCVFPGGDLDAWRPWDRRFKVEFAGRSGYARLALEAGVPIVPVANAGGHETLRVLTDGRAIAKALSFGRVARAHVFPIHLSLPWGLTFGPWPHLPWPARLRYRIGRPICTPQGTKVTDDAVRELDLRVRSAMQAELDELAKEAKA